MPWVKLEMLPDRNLAVDVAWKDAPGPGYIRLKEPVLGTSDPHLITIPGHGMAMVCSSLCTEGSHWVDDDGAKCEYVPWRMMTMKKNLVNYYQVMMQICALPLLYDVHLDALRDPVFAMARFSGKAMSEFEGFT